jgi:hypothetical protein
LWFEASLGKVVLETLSLKNPSQKRAGGVAQGIGPEFKPQYHKQNNNKKDCILKTPRSIAFARVHDAFPFPQ